MKTFYDIHTHVFDLSHPNLLVFLQLLLQDISRRAKVRWGGNVYIVNVKSFV